MFDAALPFFVTFRNFVMPDHDSWIFPWGKGGLGANHVKNYMYDQDIRNIYEWYFKIQTPDGAAPTYDNTDLTPTTANGIFDLKYNTGDSVFGISANVDLRVDYLVALGGLGEAGRMRKSTSGDLPNLTKLDGSGNIILRMNQDQAENRQYFHMLYEKGIAHDAGDLGNTHEDDDIGSFMLTVDKDQLAIDPGYRLWNNVDQTNKYLHHNTVLFNNNSMVEQINIDLFGISVPLISLPYASVENVQSNPNLQSFDLKLGYSPFLNIPFSTSAGPYLTRNVNQFRMPNGTVYYLMNDYAVGNSGISTIKWQLNGNGNIEETFYGSSEKTFVQDVSGSNRIFKWKHPCSGYKSTGKWNLYAHLAVLNGQANSPTLSTTTSATTNGTLHNSADFDLSATRDDQVTKTDGNSTHTRVSATQSTNRTIFQSILIPYKCDKENELPIITKDESSSKQVITTIKFPTLTDTSFIAQLYKTIPIGPTANTIYDTLIHLHCTTWEGLEDDSVRNPMDLENQTGFWLKHDAKSIYSRYNAKGVNYGSNGYCPATTNYFPYISINNGTYVTFHDTDIIRSTVPVNTWIENNFRMRYLSKIEPLSSVSSSDTIIFRLPDVLRGIEMVAEDLLRDSILSGRYDSLTNLFHLVMPNEAISVIFREADKCNDCFFPPTWMGIDTLFVLDQPNYIYTLGHKLDIKTTNGNLNIKNSTRMEMCSSVILHNQDSIIVEGPPQSEPMNIPSCGGVDNLKKYSKNSMLVVSPYAALVLDANSKTYIKNCAGLYIKQNGSLVVKSGALLEIGDSGSAGYAEFYAEAGAFVYIEPGAIIRYRRAIGDTIDRNYMIFGMNSGGVVAGLPYQIDSVLKADSIIPSYNTALAICDLDSLNPIGNKQWGYTNFGKPEAKFFTRSLNLCEGEPFHISLKRMLNDATLKIKVCKMDSILVPDGYGSNVWKYRCLQDSLVLDSVPPDPTCLIPRISPDEWTWYFPANTLHRVQITVTNECGKMHDTTVLVRVLDSSQISLSAPTIACEGIGTVKVIPSINQSGNIKYVFEVSEVLDSSNAEQLLSNPAQEYSYQQTGILPDTFSFPGMYFKGGRKYLIAFSYISNCGVVTVEKEVNIPTGAFIKSEKPTTFANPLHVARSVQLHGYISLADSFKWSPNTYLNRTDTLVVISTPEDPINYVLQAYYGSCTASDTIEIKYNRIANAGEADTVCFGGNEILVGNAYDASMFLAYLYYKGGSEFRDEFIDETTNDNAYFQDFTLFMHTEEFKNWSLNCSNFYEEFTEDLMKEICIKKPWYRTYFKQLNEFNDADMPALDGFVSNLNADSILRLNFINTGDWTNIKSCIPEVFARYDNFKSSSVNDYSISWTRISGDDTLQLTHYSNLALTIDSPWQTSVYIQQAITPYYAEFDETITYVDTITQAAFLVAMQMDSTVFFENISTPESNSSSYTWNFGDGTTSTNKHAIHTFPKFDTSYLVCLSVSNHCGTYTWCDTIFIDSAHWNQLDKRVHLNKNTKEETINIHLLNLEALVYPNPTESNALLVYKSEEEHFEGKLIITDIGGRSIWESDLKQKSGNIKIPSQHWHDGLYFFHLQTTSGTKTGKLIVRH